MTKAAPVGPTRTIPTSSGNECVKLFSLTCTLPGVLAIVPDNPETLMLEGYGVAKPGSLLLTASFMVIGAVLLKLVCAKAAKAKIVNIKIILLKNDKTFIVPPKN
jgi:hypothetical protein